MKDRIALELTLLRKYYPQAEYHELGTGIWFRICEYPAPGESWIWAGSTVCFEIPSGFPGAAPYGFYVENGIRLRQTNAIPQNYQEPAATPFPGVWGKFSWSVDGAWRPSADLSSGSNLTNF